MDAVAPSPRTGGSLPPPPADRPWAQAPGAPRWTPIQVVIGMVAGVLGNVLGGAVGVAVLYWRNPAAEASVATLTSSPEVILGSLLGLWAGLVGVPTWLAHRRDHMSLRADVGLRFTRLDIVVGVAAALVLRVAEFGVTTALSDAGVNLAGADNGAKFLPAQAPWALLVVLAVAAGVVAPLVEEVFFRGFVLRTLGYAWGVPAGVVTSSVLFGAIHYSPGPGAWFLVVWTAVAGTVLACLAVLTHRLGASVTTHIVYNSSAMILLLLAR